VAYVVFGMAVRILYFGVGNLEKHLLLHFIECTLAFYILMYPPYIAEVPPQTRQCPNFPKLTY